MRSDRVIPQGGEMAVDAGGAGELSDQPRKSAQDSRYPMA